MTTIKGFQGNWNGTKYDTLDADVDVTVSEVTGVWLVFGMYGDIADGPFRMVVGSPTEQDAARKYAAQCKGIGHATPTAYRVFPLASLEPIGLTGVVDEDGDETWSAFRDSWVEVRL